MKVRIEYDYDPNYYPSYFAKAWLGTEMFCNSGETFEIARERLIYTLHMLPTMEIIKRDPEEVEI